MILTSWPRHEQDIPEEDMAGVIKHAGFDAIVSRSLKATNYYRINFY
jgi:hypothetical protein